MGEIQRWFVCGKSFVNLLHLSLTKERCVIPACFRIKREEHNAGRFSVKTVNWDERLELPLFFQTDKQSFMKESTSWNDGQEVGFVYHQDVFILVYDAFVERNLPFTLN